MRVDATAPPCGMCISCHRDTIPARRDTCWQEGTRCRQAVARAGMLAAIRAVGFTYMASSAGSVGSRRAGLQHDDTIPRTVRDTIRPTLPSSGASAVGRMRSAQAGLWTATAGTGQPAPSASRPSASRSCAEPDASDRFPDDTISELGISEYGGYVHASDETRALHSPVRRAQNRTCAKEV